MCAEAIQCARQIATRNNETVILDDDDGEWLIGPRGGVRKFTTSLKRRYGFSATEDSE
jgi:pyruvate/2-oxoglutarate/acetoin dehydrogenase E1 component